jgi:uncharacterized RDD family membrane protein YckC
MTTASPRTDYAGVVSRTVAFFVDAAVIAAVAIGAAAGVWLVVTVVGGRWRGLAGWAVPLLAAAVPAMFALYGFTFWWLTGRTPGMALLGLRVTSTAGRPLCWSASLIRALILAVFPIGTLWCLVDRRHQAVHDKLARTLVVRPTLPLR